MDCFRVSQTIIDTDMAKTISANPVNSGDIVVPVMMIDFALEGISLITSMVKLSSNS